MRDANNELPDHDLTQGFPEFRQPPADTVPHVPDPGAQPIPAGPQDWRNVEFSDHGVTSTNGRAWIAPAITRETLQQKGIHDD